MPSKKYSMDCSAYVQEKKNIAILQEEHNRRNTNAPNRYSRHQPSSWNITLAIAKEINRQKKK